MGGVVSSSRLFLDLVLGVLQTQARTEDMLLHIPIWGRFFVPCLILFLFPPGPGHSAVRNAVMDGGEMAVGLDVEGCIGVK